jgi:hypothetical protein
VKINIHFWSYIAEFFLECKMFQTNVAEKVNSHILCSTLFFFFRKSYNLWDNVEKLCGAGAGHRWQYGPCALHAGYLGLQIHTHSGYVILTAFPLQQWLHEHVWMLLYTYIACLVTIKEILVIERRSYLSSYLTEPSINIVEWGIKRTNRHAVLTALDITSVLVVTEILDVVFLTLRHRQGLGVRLPSSYDVTRRRERIESTTSICYATRSECNETEQNVERLSYPCAWIITKHWEHTEAISWLRN